MLDNNYKLTSSVFNKTDLPKGTYKNPLIEGADPFVLTHDGKYYLYSSNADDGFKVFTSEDMSNWRDCGYCLKKGDVVGEKWFWAPEITYKNKKFYMVYAAEEHLAIAVADSPLGPFIQKEKKWLLDDKAIDGHFFVDDDGITYLYYVHINNGNEIYMAKMSDDLSCVDMQSIRFLIRAEEEWELKDWNVVEGPFVLKYKGKYYLTYSANHTRCQDYAVGYAVSESPYGPFIKYEKNPILHKDEGNGVYGTGHHSFTRSKDGKELVCVYHRHNRKEEYQPRLTCIDRASFETDKNGETVLVVHGPTTTPQKAF